jgi:hypothetical protein
MKISTLLMMLFALCLIPVSVKGADIDGKWKSYGTSLTMLGDTYFAFNADGETLSGTVSYPPGIEHKISKGKISGDKIQFIVDTYPLGDSKLTFNGVIKGDEMKLTYQVGTSPNYIPPVSGNNSSVPNNPKVHSGSSRGNPNIPPTKELLLKKVKE